MSSSWHGGKGDKVRISDYSNYRNNYENIFRKMGKKPIKLRYNSVLLVGDSHGEKYVTKVLENVIPHGSDVVHLGDVGLGFGIEPYSIEDSENWLEETDKFCIKNNINLYIIRGNHDNPFFWNKNLVYRNVKLVDTGEILEFQNGKSAYIIGGGLSIDRCARQEKVSYWSDEITRIPSEGIKECDFVFSHDCPEYFNHSTEGLSSRYPNFTEKDTNLVNDATLQRQTVGYIVDKVSPTVLFSGHFHNTMTDRKHGIYYRCLDINEVYEFDSEYDY